ncbi:hypothetical protein SAMN02745166_00773 [Prosthecobacter debontii]|uniref:Uncharacterized protein n=1 Tax=Prosthecobacter debontii TaxID=48467 RepID=A0A1T4WW54_9BACT|nr:hypothetical protein SAMN02745166_00773 [Prosthecobacter debontii]
MGGRIVIVLKDQYPLLDQKKAQTTPNASQCHPLHGCHPHTNRQLIPSSMHRMREGRDANRICGQGPTQGSDMPIRMNECGNQNENEKGLTILKLGNRSHLPLRLSML